MSFVRSLAPRLWPRPPAPGAPGAPKQVRTRLPSRSSRPGIPPPTRLPAPHNTVLNRYAPGNLALWRTEHRGPRRPSPQSPRVSGSLSPTGLRRSSFPPRGRQRRFQWRRSRPSTTIPYLPPPSPDGPPSARSAIRSLRAPVPRQSSIFPSSQIRHPRQYPRSASGRKASPPSVSPTSQFGTEQPLTKPSLSRLSLSRCTVGAPTPLRPQRGARGDPCRRPLVSSAADRSRAPRPPSPSRSDDWRCDRPRRTSHTITVPATMRRRSLRRPRPSRHRSSA